MHVTMIQNGSISMVITPDTEIERLQLVELFKSPVDTSIIDKAQILDKNIADSIVITTAKGIKQQA